jgi:hypothetical protein
MVAHGLKTKTGIKQYNIRCHNQKDHKQKYMDFSGWHRTNKNKPAKASLIVLQNILLKQSSHNELDVYAGYVLAETTAKGGRPFQDCEPIRQFC